jgi:hypothetical protein
MWGLGAAYAIVLTVRDFLEPELAVPIGRDFSNLWVAGNLALEGRVAEIYSIPQFQAAIKLLLDIPALQNFSYPPHDLFLAVPVATMPYFVALATWTILGALFFVWTARPHVTFNPLLAALTPASLINIWTGHYGFLLGGLWLLFFQYLGTKRAGVVAAIMTIKPHMGLLIAVAALRHRTTLFTAIVGALLAIGVSALVFGASAWDKYLFVTAKDQTEILTDQTASFFYSMMPTAFVSYGLGTTAAIAQIVTAVLAIAMLTRLKTPDPFAFATATFLIVPYAFNYDMTVACLGFAILLHSQWDVLSWLQRSIAGAAFLSPELTFLVPWLVPPLLLCGLALQVTFTGERNRRDMPRLDHDYRPASAAGSK